MVISMLYVLYFAVLTPELRDKLLDYSERYVTTRTYQNIFCPPTTDDEQKDLAIQTKIRSLHWVNAHLLDTPLDERIDEVHAKVEQAITGRCFKFSIVSSSLVFNVAVQKAIPINYADFSSVLL